jgi:drug/metabolite transporter (DMT)-like permease
VTRRGALLFAALGLAWGIPYLLIKIAVTELDPIVVVLGRCVVGALLLLPLALARREIMPVLRRWPVLLLYTVVEIVLPWFFLSSAEQRLPSSTSGLLIAAVPLVSVGVAFLFGRPERLSGLNWVGILAGMLGVAALVGLDVAGSDLVGVLQMIVVVIGYAFGPAIMAHSMSDLPGFGVVMLSLALAALIDLPIAFATDAFPSAWPSPAGWVPVLLLGVICSATAFVLMFALVAEIGPVRSTAITYVNPAVAIVAGVIVLHERVTVWTFVGFALVLGGSFLVTRRRRVVPPNDPAAPPVT